MSERHGAAHTGDMGVHRGHVSTVYSGSYRVGSGQWARTSTHKAVLTEHTQLYIGSFRGLV